MKLIIAGSRSIKSYSTVRAAILESGLWERHKRAIEVVSGKAKGVDTLGEIFASKADLKLHEKPADWDDIDVPGAVIRYNWEGKPYNALAGHWRNEEMAQFADEALIVWDGKSTGSLDMLHRMIALEKPVYLFPLRIGTDTLDGLENKGVQIIFPNSLTSS
jgi:hypothetical protein